MNCHAWSGILHNHFKLWSWNFRFYSRKNHYLRVFFYFLVQLKSKTPWIATKKIMLKKIKNLLPKYPLMVVNSQISNPLAYEFFICCFPIVIVSSIFRVSTMLINPSCSSNVTAPTEGQSSILPMYVIMCNSDCESHQFHVIYFLIKVQI